jgi:hypothetical protein
MTVLLTNLPSNDAKPVSPNQLDYPTFVRAMFFASGVLMLITGFIFVGQLFNTLPSCTGANCVGPSLMWGSFTNDLNPAWRFVFSLAPNAFVLNWTPVFLGLLSIICHWPGFGFDFCTRSFLHVALYNLLCALLLFAYSGNMGVLSAVFCILVAICALPLHFSRHRGEKTTLHITIGTGVLAKMGYVADNALVISIARALGLGLGLITIAIGFIHVFSENFVWCQPSATQQCLGPSIVWNGANGAAFTAQSNGFFSMWGRVFTLQPEILGPLWGPVVFGWITVLQHIEHRNWPSISGSWPRAFLWFMFMALFCQFGYSGALGILVGFASVLEALLALLITAGGGGTTATHYSIHIRWLD